MAAAVLALVRQNGRLLLRLDELEARVGGEGDAGWAEAEAHDGLPIGTPVPPFGLSGLYGETITLGALIAAEKPLLLLFTDPACGPCNALLPEIAAWQTEHADDLTFAVLTRGSADDNRAKVREHGVTGVWLDADLAVYSSLQAIGTPSATLIDVDGRVASPIVAGEKAIAQLVTQAAGGFPVLQVGAPQHPPVPPRLAVGAPVPGIELPDLNGHTVELASVDRDTLVLFWNPGCSFCRQMLDELREWESAPPPNAPRLVLVSTGTVEDNIEMNLASEVLLDQAFAAGAAFGTTGTPSAVLVGRDGRIASALAVGATEVMSLARL
jgi:thiol-disulfide isomerase/thioredoxin